MPPKKKVITSDQSAAVQANAMPIVLATASATVTASSDAVLQQPLLDTEDKKNKRRGRKPRDKFNFEDTIDSPNSIAEMDTNIIIKLPISCMDLDKELNLSTNIINNDPKPFDSNEDRGYQQLQSAPTTDNIYNPVMPNTNNTNTATATNRPVTEIIAKTSVGIPQQYNVSTVQNPVYMDYYQNKINDLLSDLDENSAKKKLTQIEILLNKKYKTSKQIELLHTLTLTNEGNKWPKTTNIHCFCCCHGFENTPWGIPTKYDGNTGIFNLYGIFCSPNCVLAHLLNHETNTMVLWEQISLLNLLHYKIYETDDNLVPAPDKICLKCFGGPLSIDEYRGLTLKNDKLYAINFPPCIIVTPVLEETKKIFNQDSYFIPIDKKRINKIQTELKIKRTNTSNKTKNTLDSVMNISYSS